MSRAHARRPTPARMVRAPGPVPASSPELSSMSASSPPVRRLKQAWSGGRGRNLPGRDVHTRDEEPRDRVGVARARRRHRRVGSRPEETARRAGRSARDRADPHDEAPVGARLHRGGRRSCERGVGSEHPLRSPRGRGRDAAARAERWERRALETSTSCGSWRAGSTAERAWTPSGPGRAARARPARAAPSEPTPRSRHERATTPADLGAGVVDVPSMRPAGRMSPSSDAERVGAARRAGASATEVRPRRFCPGASGGTHRSPSVRGGGPRVRAHAAAARPNSRP